jgi:DnaJ-class molecular chaperone
MIKDTRLYDRLKITPSATENQIKKAYNKMSIKWHPDKHINMTEGEKEKATKKFQKISQAKEILLDAKKREKYNRIGMDILKSKTVKLLN